MEYSKIQDRLNERTHAALNESIEGATEANMDMRAAKAAEIEKRGFVYQGDSNQNWGLRNVGNGTGFTGGAPYYGRGLELMMGNFSLQPFGLGGGIGNNVSMSPSMFAGTGGGTAYNKNTHVAKMKMAMAVEAYKGFGVVKNVIDLMCNFASEGLTIVHPRQPIERFYRRWAESVDLQGRAKDILRYYYKFGNAFVYTTMGKVDENAYTRMKSARGSQATGDNNDPAQPERDAEVEEEKGKPVGDRLIPWRYTLLNPFQMEIKGDKFFGQSKWVFVLDEKTMTEVKTKVGNQNVDFLDESDVNLPPEFKTLLNTKDGREVELDQAKLWTFHYMKDDHEDWADPMVWPVMNDIMYKNSLRAMDMSVVNSTINAVTIFKLGSFKDGFIAPKSHFKQFSEMLRAPTYSHNIVWNDTVSIESNYPPIDKILGIEKYQSVDKDILAGLGIPAILVDGAGGSFSNAFLQVRTLLERLEEGRGELLKWINRQLRLVAETMGHRDIPTIKFGQMSLRDEQAEKTLIIQLLDRNVISAEAVHEVFGLDTMLELERMRREKKLADDEELLIKHGPYTDPMTDVDQEEIMDKEFEHQNEQMDKEMVLRDKEQKMNMQLKKQQMTEQMKMRKQQMKMQQRRQNSKGPGGRPGGSKGIPQKKKRVTKPKGQGLGSIATYESFKTTASVAYEIVENALTNLMLEARGLEYKKELSKEDRENLEGLVYAVFSNLSVWDSVDDEVVTSILANDLTIDGTVDAIVQERLSTFTTEPTAQDRRDVRASAIAYIWTKEFEDEQGEE
jgi:hypothetical protein